MSDFLIQPRNRLDPAAVRDHGPVLLPQSCRKWIRVNRGRVCPICRHDSWCSISGDGAVVCCARVESGSVKHLTGAGGEHVGYLHILVERGGERRQIQPYVKRIRFAVPVATAKMALLAEKCVLDLTPTRASWLACNLSVSEKSLRDLSVGWSSEHRAFTFPMRNHLGVIMGIRLRSMKGAKFAVLGSHEGLFIPANLHADGMLVVVEGASDCAAGIDLDLSVVGRPSCTGGTRYVTELVRRRGDRVVAIMADGDAQGVRGARALASVLQLHVRTVKVLTPPGGTKDLREWKRRGATSADMRAAIDSAPIGQLRVVGPHQSQEIVHG